MTSGPEIVVKPLGLRVSQAAIALMLTGTAFGISVLAIAGPWRFVMLAAALVVIPLATLRGLRLLLLVDEDRVVARNYWRTRHVRWMDVTDVGVGFETMGITPVPALAFRLRDGSTVRCQATPQRQRDREELLERLRPYAARWGARCHY